MLCLISCLFCFLSLGDKEFCLVSCLYLLSCLIFCLVSVVLSSAVSLSSLFVFCLVSCVLSSVYLLFLWSLLSYLLFCPLMSPLSPSPPSSRSGPLISPTLPLRLPRMQRCLPQLGPNFVVAPPAARIFKTKQEHNH